MNLPTAKRPAAPTGRRLVAVGIIRHHHGRTLRLTVTPAGATGTSRPEVTR
jgi:hypothetical protein